MPTSAPVPSDPSTAKALVVPAAIVAALTGAVVASQGKINGDLSEVGAGVWLASWFSYAGTLVTVLIVIAAQGRLRWTVRTLQRDGRWWWYAVGLCGIPIVLASTLGIPIVGVAIASVCSVAGQTVSGLGFDARGVGLAQPLALSRRRVLAGATALAGLGVAVASGTTGPSAQPLVVVVVGIALFLGGMVLCGQQAGNGHVASVTGDPVTPALTSVIGGTVGVSVILGVVAALGGLEHLALPGLSQWYLYLGGPLGAVITVASAWCVRHLGTFALTLALVGGQMLAAMALDATGPLGLQGPTVIATVVILAAVVLAIDIRPSRPVRHR